MEQYSWENFPLQMEPMGHQDDSTSDDEYDEFLREILQQPADLSPVIETESLGFQKNSSSSGSEEFAAGKKVQPRTFILSFDNSTILPAEPALITGGGATHSNSKSGKRNQENLKKSEPKPRTPQKAKKSRSDSQTVDHVIAERKRRQDLTEKFIALSATIPGLKKTDKSSIVDGAISYVKQLQERVTELEQAGNGRGRESTILLKKKISLMSVEDTSSDTNDELLPDVKARVLENDVIIVIHCEKENGIELKILDLLQNLRLCVTGTTVLPFGNSTLSITIIAQIADACNKTTVTDIEDNVRHVLLNDDRFPPQLSC